MISATQQPLNPLQRAYLMGRNGQVPLGGVAMHDFRQFYCDLSLEELTSALHALAEQHAALRTVIDENQYTQSVREEVVLNIDHCDLSQHSKADATQEVERLVEQHSHSILPLDKPLWRMCLIQLPKALLSKTWQQDSSGALLLTSFDGLILDGHAISVLLNTLFNKEPYSPSAIANNTPPSYFANTPNDQNYWQDKLANIDEVITLPWKRDLEGIFNPDYKREGILLPHPFWQSLAKLGAQHQLLPNSVLTAALFEVLALWANEHKLLVSMPISNSIMHKELGNHSSFIAISYRSSADKGFVEKAKGIQIDVLEAMAHTSFSGVELGKALVKKTAKLVTLPVAITNGLSWSNDPYQRAKYVSGLTQTPQLALDIRISKTANNEIAIDFDYAVQALPEMVIQQMLQTLEHYLRTLSQTENLQNITVPSLFNRPQNRTDEADHDSNNLVESSDKNQLAEELSPQVEDYLTKIKGHLTAANNPRSALICDDKAISYQTLGKQIAKVIHQLTLANLKQGDAVAICLPKSPEHIAVTLACSLANMLWLPVDMDSPDERIQYMVTNCQANLIITDRELDYGIDTLNIHEILNNPELSEELTCEPVFSAEPGYYLYTSGSTGLPKCVVMNHKATANVVEITNQRWNLSQDDVLFSATPLHHDMSVYELFGAMSLGATLVVPTPEQVKSAMDWARLVEQHKVTVWSSVPAIVDMLLACAQPEQLVSLKLVSQGGDYVKTTVINQLREYLPNARLFSIGGPTETTIWSIWHEISSEDTQVIPYGDSLKHNRYYIINEQGQHCPHFVIGTIYMSGVNLANGYLKDGVINQNDFDIIKTPEGKSVRVFKTSDRGYFREDGKIIFSGRKEGYLKVRGVRIASSEVELSLTQHPAIRDAIAMSCVNPQYKTSELVAAYVTEKQQKVDSSELRRFLQSKLPASHIPSRWLALDSFPLTRNRKVDRKHLQVVAEQELYQTYGASSATISKPATTNTPLETAVIKAFAETLETDPSAISKQTEIMSLGLRPKQLGQIAKRLSEETQGEVSLYTLAKASTLNDVITSIKAQNSQAEAI